ncbi:MAG: arsenate reductase (glutaredoxin) [Leucothrix sp.]
MSKKAIIYHNPRCSKSRATLAILEERNESIDVIQYLETPPSKETLRHILTTLDMTPRALMRRNEVEYAANGLADESLTDEQLIDAMIAHPKLIERPIVIKGNKVAIGRPPESVLAIL